MPRYNDKARIRDHYDRVSPYYYDLWGEHLHHGYWIRGDETKEQAQVQLIEHLARAAEIQPGSRILDVGCGFGASSIYLARNYAAEATGITISPIQVEIAGKAASTENVKAKFCLMDAEAMKFDQKFEVVWSVESISHYQNKKRFFACAANLLERGGTLAMLDWFKKANLNSAAHEKFIQPIERGMLVGLHTMEDYKSFMQSNHLQITRSEILNQNCAQTWDLCLDIIKKRSFWALAARNGAEFVDFLRAFRAMKAGFASGNFVYGLLVAKKFNGCETMRGAVAATS
jgi:cyclopropane fatty-acyl-phospholipid synthase-like methyltransferase